MAPFRVAETNRHYWGKHYGEGQNRQPEDGGFHELNARNDLFQFARESECDWVLMCDADEFFLENTIEAIIAAHAADKQIIMFSTHHLLSPTTYAYQGDRYKKVKEDAVMYDPTARGLRLGHDHRYGPHPDEDYVARLPNRTSDSYLENRAYADTYPAHGVFHIHLKYLLADGRWQRRIAPYEEFPLDCQIPDELLQLYLSDRQPVAE